MDRLNQNIVNFELELAGINATLTRIEHNIKMYIDKLEGKY